MKKYLPILLLFAFAPFCTALAQTTPPNIVVILADDLGYGGVGFNGCADIPTPNNGAVFSVLISDRAGSVISNNATRIFGNSSKRCRLANEPTPTNFSFSSANPSARYISRWAK